MEIEALDDLPKKQGYRRPYYRVRKQLSDLLGPLKGYLYAQIGRRWDTVYSEIRHQIDPNSVTQLHIRTRRDTRVKGRVLQIAAAQDDISLMSGYVLGMARQGRLSSFELSGCPNIAVLAEQRGAMAAARPGRTAARSSGQAHFIRVKKKGTGAMSGKPGRRSDEGAPTRTKSARQRRACLGRSPDYRGSLHHLSPARPMPLPGIVDNLVHHFRSPGRSASKGYAQSSRIVRPVPTDPSVCLAASDHRRVVAGIPSSSRIQLAAGGLRRWRARIPRAIPPR